MIKKSRKCAIYVTRDYCLIHISMQRSIFLPRQALKFWTGSRLKRIIKFPYHDDDASHDKALFQFEITYPANIYLFKVNKRNTRKKCEICPKLTIKTPEQRQRCLYFKLWKYFTSFSKASIVELNRYFCWVWDWNEKSYLF